LYFTVISVSPSHDGHSIPKVSSTTYWSSSLLHYSIFHLCKSIFFHPRYPERILSCYFAQNRPSGPILHHSASIVDTIQTHFMLWLSVTHRQRIVNTGYRSVYDCLAVTFFPLCPKCRRLCMPVPGSQRRWHPLLTDDVIDTFTLSSEWISAPKRCLHAILPRMRICGRLSVKYPRSMTRKVCHEAD
jgi:hypothetical protein